MCWDLPALLQTLGTQCPDVTWTLSPAVGETELLINALADSALAWHKAPPAC